MSSLGTCRERRLKSEFSRLSLLLKTVFRAWLVVERPRRNKKNKFDWLRDPAILHAIYSYRIDLRSFLRSLDHLFLEISLGKYLLVTCTFSIGVGRNIAVRNTIDNIPRDPFASAVDSCFILQGLLDFLA